MSTARVDFTRGAAERIARVVRRVETGDRDGKPLTFNRVPEQPGKVFRTGTFDGTWAKNATAVVTFRTPTSVTAVLTAMAYNIFATIGTSTASTATLNCAVAKDGTAWYLIAAECEE